MYFSPYEPPFPFRNPHLQTIYPTLFRKTPLVTKRREGIDPRICAAVALSVPCDLASSAKQLERWQNRIYMARFMRSLREKVKEKASRFPGQIQTEGLDAMRTFTEFDDAYTGPVHGFTNAEDYWYRSSCGRVLEQIRIPCLLIKAADDLFLTKECYPHRTSESNSSFFLETPRHGGHLGFVDFHPDKEYWSERRTIAFLKQS